MLEGRAKSAKATTDIVNITHITYVKGGGPERHISINFQNPTVKVFDSGVLDII